ncbi:hypothetical protein F4814DRAFT_88177 [Daldinia grandis]|nr:hypothetical protein F4814DRAFT_88177 [Daldinia grandis]
MAPPYHTLTINMGGTLSLVAYQHLRLILDFIILEVSNSSLFPSFSFLRMVTIFPCRIFPFIFIFIIIIISTYVTFCSYLTLGTFTQPALIIIPGN